MITSNNRIAIVPTGGGVGGGRGRFIEGGDILASKILILNLAGGLLYYYFYKM